MAKSIYEDAEALDALHYCRRFTDIFRTLRCYDYLADMTLEEYVETALKAADDLKYFLDPDKGISPRTRCPTRMRRPSRAPFSSTTI